MKTIKRTDVKKLSINRDSLRVLSNDTLNAAVGGVAPPTYFCATARC
jgi:hypothetical protein